MLSFSDNFFLKTTRPVVLIFSALFPQTKVSAAHGHDCLNCKHQSNVYKLLLVLEAQILDTAFSSGVERCRSKTFSILSILGFALRSTPLFHHHFIIHPVLFILCLISVKRVKSSIIPVVCIASHLSNHLLIYVWAMHSVLWVIYSSSSRREWRSVLCYLLYACLIRVSCVILTFILSPVTCVNLIWLGTVWIIGYLSRSLYSYCFDIIWRVLSCSSESIYKSKATERVSGFPHMVCLNFIEKRVINLKLKIDAVSV